jgi:23S rRNA (uracil1939-C5)-methyltransferase
VVRRLEASLATAERETVGDIELAENIDASQRAVHFELLPDADASRLATLAQVDGLAGASCAHPENPRTIDLFGSPILSDTIRGRSLDRHVRSFFQGNRYLLAPLVDHVLGHVGEGPLVDLYAGVGLFSVTAETVGAGPITAVEGDRFAARDLRRNATDITVMAMPVEDYVGRQGAAPATLIVDPPRTGMSKQAMAGVIRLGAARMIYVSCDIATLARDARLLLDAGYRIVDTRAFDLFPNTAHVETVIAFAR